MLGPVDRKRWRANTVATLLCNGGTCSTDNSQQLLHLACIANKCRVICRNAAASAAAGSTCSTDSSQQLLHLACKSNTCCVMCRKAPVSAAVAAAAVKCTDCQTTEVAALADHLCCYPATPTSGDLNPFMSQSSFMYQHVDRVAVAIPGSHLIATQQRLQHVLRHSRAPWYISDNPLATATTYHTFKLFRARWYVPRTDFPGLQLDFETVVIAAQNNTPSSTDHPSRQKNSTSGMCVLNMRFRCRQTSVPGIKGLLHRIRSSHILTEGTQKAPAGAGAIFSVGMVFAAPAGVVGCATSASVTCLGS